MKQVLQNPKSGVLELAEVPLPAVERGQVLVRNCFSAVSAGTERMALDFARQSLLGKARSRPDLVRQVARKLRQEGPLPTYRAVVNRLDAPQPLGYSSAGVVEAVDGGVTRFSTGDRVACAGAGYANHAEFVSVPENLVVRVPDSVELEHAAFATLGAIALHGVRIAAPMLGEIACVIGLGLIGQLGVQLLRANGCRVLAVDLDPQRVKQAAAQGAEWGAQPQDDFDAWKRDGTAGYGADLALVTASSETSAPVRLAADLCRLRGRISLVGAMPIELDRRVVYAKEIELRMSTSYGPGRYDRAYEEEGLDYPLPYVRWTENRNLQAFLALIASGSVRVDALDTETVPFAEAVEVYGDLSKGTQRPLATLFRYADAPSRSRTFAREDRPHERSSPRTSDRVGIGFLGVGSYAKSVLLPSVARRAEVERVALVANTGPSVRHAAQRFAFARWSTDPDAIFSDPGVDLVFIATRHDSHASLAVRALRAGKAVWLEKPVGLDASQVSEVVEAARETNGFLTIGYNRRFSRHASAVREAFGTRRGPLAIHYSVAAGPPPVDSWIMDPECGGGRVIGEVCHFVDLCLYWAGVPAVSVFAQRLGQEPGLDDSLIAIVRFADGSIATIEYLAHAHPSVPKERIELTADGHTAVCTNFRVTDIRPGGRVKTRNQDKGQDAAIEATLRAIAEGTPSRFSLEEITTVSAVTFAIERSAASGTPVTLERSSDPEVVI